jgi:flagellar basal body-associated protein FliL
VNFYEVLADGYHSPLTKTQIAGLFHAGRLRRGHRCKHVTGKEWQTIDELFPLLKYQPSEPALNYSQEPDSFSARTWILIIALLAVAVAAIAGYYFSSGATAPPPRTHVTDSRWPRTIVITPSPDVLSRQPPTDDRVSIAPPVLVEAYSPRVASQEQQVAAPRRQVEQRAPDQAQVHADRTTAEHKVAGQDAIIPLDRETPVNVGGYAVNVMIHDNDTTSFDVWINGLRRREVPKQKGITGSRTDETLIYGSGRARLYYVWEISGQLNHCRLRVRED